MMDKIIQYHMRKISSNEIAKALDEYTYSITDVFKCRACNQELPIAFNVITEGFCFLCDPNVTLEECLSDEPLEKKQLIIIDMTKSEAINKIATESVLTLIQARIIIDSHNIPNDRFQEITQLIIHLANNNIGIEEIHKSIPEYLNGEWSAAMPKETIDWTKADSEGNITIPDELDPLFHKIGMQLRFHTISGKNELQTVVDILWNADQFYRNKYGR